MTTTERESIKMPELPEGFKGAREIPDWIWKILDESPRAEEGWQKLIGICEENEPDERELYLALQKYRKEKI